jgi:hypothetical protein
MLPNEHHSTGESVQSVTWHWIPPVSALFSHDLDNRVVVVTAGWMNGYSGRLINNYHVIVFVDDGNRSGGDRGFVSVEGMGNNISVFDQSMD